MNKDLYAIVYFYDNEWCICGDSTYTDYNKAVEQCKSSMLEDDPEDDIPYMVVKLTPISKFTYTARIKEEKL